MRLNSIQIERTLFQFDAEAIPTEHPAISELEQLFGDHTYFLDRKGLNIVEPVEAGEENGPASQMGVVVNLADWSDVGMARLRPHQPESTEVLIDLGSDGLANGHRS
jgi:hypothetical protein